MTCPRCKCEECRRVELHAVLARRIESRETSFADSELRRAFELLPQARRFAEPREPGRVPVDPDAEQLAAQVGALNEELQRGAA
jgi:hypothetical protein